MEQIAEWIGALDSFLWGPPLLVLLVGCHIFLTFYLKFVQRYVFLGIKLSVRNDFGADGDISQFGALAIALAATIGTGNIIGVGTAIVCGGPGAIFWCWLCGVFGIATKYAEAVLAVKYRIVDTDGMIRGGPMYAIERGMKCKWLAVLFSVFTLLACCGIGSMTQSNAVAETIQKTFSAPMWATGAVEALLILLVVIGGLKFISKVCGALVPAMAVLYVLGCFVILGRNASAVLPAIRLIVTEAFSMKSVGGGLLGVAMMTAIRYGVARGLFSNESGLGSAPLVAASAKTANPVRQALISSTGTFWDTVCICALTGVCLVSSALKLNPNPDFSQLTASELAFNAFDRIPYAGKYILAVCLSIFAYTTILGWFCYGRQAIHYLGGKLMFQVFRAAYIPLVFLGAVLTLKTVWNISDIANGLMVIPNVICLLWLCRIVKSETANYLWTGRIDEPDPECVRVNQEGKAIDPDRMDA
ncbi:MAG: sodium:alanine symporter family protein [Lentisphaeria bacterium]|nr:sodium:alanine symporter family protein [Lentisphaeria bacterium]